MEQADRAAYEQSQQQHQTPDEAGRPVVGRQPPEQDQSIVDPQGRGLSLSRRHTTVGVDPLDQVDWTFRSAVIKEPDGSVVFSMDDCEVPKGWSQLATDIAVSKYFRKAGVPGTGHEVSVRQLVHRVANTIRHAGEERGYFASVADADTFEAELSHLLVTQRGAFNSPVWFNCGLWHHYAVEGSGGNWAWDDHKSDIIKLKNNYTRPQCSACFIQAVEDDLMSIFDLAKSEARLFKYGSGTGTNFSRIRAREEKLRGGGTSSGLMSFLEVLDKGAGATKSGGTTRRAAKMVCLDLDHPDILDFIDWKVNEERKVAALIAAGYSSDFNGEAYKTVSGQNSNNSVRVSDAFMQAYLDGGSWSTTYRTTGQTAATHKARDLMRKIAYAAWACADPGVQFDTTINDWHTCADTDRIYASNPCSEYMFLDDSACNLASINLMKYLSAEGTFDVEGYEHAIRTFIIAMEVLVDFSSYPTHRIAYNSHDYRPLGLGYANLGSLLMCSGLPYDSDKGRALSAALTAILTGESYRTSAELAAARGPFTGYARNRDSFLRVIRKHRDAAYQIDSRFCPPPLLRAARDAWDGALQQGEAHGFRNAQTTVLAPTGTIGLLMDCDTTGVEPDFSLVKWKKLAGGGHFKIVNQSLGRALQRLGYRQDQVDAIVTYVLGHGTIEGAPHISVEWMRAHNLTDTQIAEARAAVEANKAIDQFTPHLNPGALRTLGLSVEQIRAVTTYVNGAQTVEGAPQLWEDHLPVFDCANKCGTGERFIAPLGHVHMMAATQPFLSGAISKTVNVPSETTVEEIEEIYVEAWKTGLKAIAIYRDGSKLSQPLNVTDGSSEQTDDEEVPTVVVAPARPAGLVRGERKVLPKKRVGFTIESEVGSHKVFLRTGEYEDGTLGEIFIDMYKEGAAYRSLVNCFAIAVSIGLQYGVPLEKFVNSFTFTRFEPSGMTDHPNIRTATSLLDFVFRVLGMEYLGRTDFVHIQPKSIDEPVLPPVAGAQAAPVLAAAAAAGAATAAVVDATLRSEAARSSAASAALENMMGDAPPCDACGHITVRNGACYKCINCGNSMGCS